MRSKSLGPNVPTLMHGTIGVLQVCLLGWRNFPRVLHFLEKNSCLATLTFVRLHVLVRSYRRMAKRSTTVKQASSTTSGNEDRVSSAAVSSGSTPQMSQAVFLPRPAKKETMSHPVRMWNMGKPKALSQPNAVLSCI